MPGGDINARRMINYSKILAAGHGAGGMEKTKMDMDHFVVDLAIARREKEAALKEANERLEQIKQDPAYQAALERYKNEAQTVEDIEAAIREMAIEAYTNGDKLHAVVGIRKKKVLNYEYAQARTWCEANLPEAIVLDVKLFEKYAREQSVKPLDFVRVLTELQATIKTDLSEYVPVVVEEPEEEPAF